jgi:hypothetical protein
MATYLNTYTCHACNETWQIESDSMHDDRCPECDATNEPSDSDPIDGCDCAVCGEVYPLSLMVTMEFGPEVCEGCLHDHTQAIDAGDETFYHLSEEY